MSNGSFSGGFVDTIRLTENGKAHPPPPNYLQTPFESLHCSFISCPIPSVASASSLESDPMETIGNELKRALEVLFCNAPGTTEQQKRDP